MAAAAAAAGGEGDVGGGNSSFAYVDFHCPNDKALARLFSTYNGCKWKGGKLRLEKAKEHYLTRLKREWEQDAAAAASKEAALKDNAENQKPKLDKAALEGLKINIYFPKLRKVKALPLKGTGKHKYSFRHIEVPSYPIHFCDCEEHCGPPEEANNEYASVLNAAAYEKERNIMNSVMNKLFEKENEHFDSGAMEKCDDRTDTIEPSNTVNGMQIEETEDAPEDLDDLQMEETEESSDEDLDDDLVINIAPRKSNKPAVRENIKQEVNKDSQLQKRPRIEETSLPKKRQKSEASSEPIKRNGEQHVSVTLDTRTAGKTLPAKSEASQNEQKSLDLKGKRTYEFSSALPKDKSSADPQGITALASSSIKTGSAQNTGSIEPKRGYSWIQKSAWRDLVGGTGSASFSISQVLPNNNPAPAVFSNVAGSERSSKSSEATAQLLSSVGTLSTSTADESTDHAIGGEPKESNKPQKVRVVPKITISEVCPFMRNTESQKQWAKAKKAVTGFAKKRNESSTGKGKPSNKQ
uniref:Uncharacterized protein n=1 Tax=Zea mays TaxID=4577 RepID=A0A804P5A0_MAIZE